MFAYSWRRDPATDQLLCGTLLTLYLRRVAAASRCRHTRRLGCYRHHYVSIKLLLVEVKQQTMTAQYEAGKRRL